MFPATIRKIFGKNPDSFRKWSGKHPETYLFADFCSGRFWKNIRKYSRFVRVIVRNKSRNIPEMSKRFPTILLSLNLRTVPPDIFRNVAGNSLDLFREPPGLSRKYPGQFPENFPDLLDFMCDFPQIVLERFRAVSANFSGKYYPPG